MIHHIKQKVTAQFQATKECDVCHNQYSDPSVVDKQHWKSGELWDFQEFYHIEFTGGFGSIFGDGSRVECDICQSCLKEMIWKYCRIDGQPTEKEDK